MSHPPPPHPVTQRQVSGEETEDGEWLSNPRLRLLENAVGGGCGGVRACGVWGAESIRKSPPVFDKEGMVIPSGLRCVRGRSPLHPLTPVLSGPDPLHSSCDPEHIQAGQTFYTINFRKETFSVPLTSVPQHGTRLKTPVPGYFGSSISPSQLSTSGFPQALTTAYPSSSPSPQARPARSQLWAPSGLREGGGAAEAGRGEEGRAARAHHGEAGEKSRSPAGRFKLGAA